MLQFCRCVHRGGDNVLFGRGGVVDEDGKYVELSGIPTRIWGSYAFPKADYRDEKVVYCGYLVNHWGHFLVEAVTRLWYVLENDATIDKYVFFLKENEQRELKGNYREFLRLLGILDKIEIIDQPTTYREVIVPEIAFRCMEFYSPGFLAIFDAIGCRKRKSFLRVPASQRGMILSLAERALTTFSYGMGLRFFIRKGLAFPK